MGRTMSAAPDAGTPCGDRAGKDDSTAAVCARTTDGHGLESGETLGCRLKPGQWAGIPTASCSRSARLLKLVNPFWSS